ncbi:putative RNA-directed DNA polymerase [Helianthus debilis subsp. tardiflorus]
MSPLYLCFIICNHLYIGIYESVSNVQKYKNNLFLLYGNQSLLTPLSYSIQTNLAAFFFPYNRHIMSSSIIIELSTHTHFPIKLTTTNFPSWRKHVLAMLMGLELEQFVDGRTEPPPKTLEGKPNPAYRLWFRQDQILLGALLGSCSDTIQPLVSSAETARQLFQRLSESYASVSRSRIISLRTKLSATNKGSRPVAEYLNEMKSIADELALAQKPVDDDDLTAHILAHLGEDYKEITAALKTLHTSITFSDLYEKLIDHERSLLESKSVPVLTTVNTAQRQGPRNQYRPNSAARFSNRPNASGPRQTTSANNNSTITYRTNRNNLFCQFCSIPGHDTKDCSKFARFLQNNNLALATPATNSTVNSTMATSSSSLMFDSGASDHATADQNFVHHLSEYGGPDEIILGNGSSHGGETHAGSQH